jgi:hypothetical protein
MRSKHAFISVVYSTLWQPLSIKKQIVPGVTGRWGGGEGKRSMSGLNNNWNGDVQYMATSYTQNLALLPSSVAWLIQLSLLPIQLIKVIIN